MHYLNDIWLTVCEDAAGINGTLDRSERIEKLSAGLHEYVNVWLAADYEKGRDGWYDKKRQLQIHSDAARHIQRIIAWAIVQQFDLDRTWWDGIVNPPRPNQSTSGIDVSEPHQ
jgi:hypothetical protein